MASASPTLVASTPTSRPAVRKRDTSRTTGNSLVIRIGRDRLASQERTAADGAAETAGHPDTSTVVAEANNAAQQQQPPAAGPGPSSSQQQQQQQPTEQQQQQQPADDDADVIVIGSDRSDEEADEVIITGVTLPRKRPRRVGPPGWTPSPQQQQARAAVHRAMPAVPTWEQPAAPPARPPSPEPAIKCLICLEGIKTDNMATTPCGHMFCYDCLTDAVKVTKRCPKCRKSTTVKQIKRLFPN
eukprot:GHRR01001700.1.p1 GENE.GHRR01001700.1~~GHRR01001700.1.p1  ORF type:complete len:243 (+),score=91.74 GHRR01001700.1:331-1059(+)